MKRFYKEAEVAREGSEFQVLLDGKPIKTPSRNALIVPTLPLAEAIAEEWSVQGEKIDPKSMPLTGLAMAAIDGAADERAAQTLAFAKSDLLCYRADEPAELAARQAAEWDPLLNWVAERHGARLSVVTGIVFVEQPPEALAALERAVSGFSGFHLAGLHSAATITGSLVLALALAEGRLDAGEAFRRATLDEAFQAEQWGMDAAAKARLDGLAAELAAAERFMRLLVLP